jgi:tetratricopeptide (TPR) repeat protein
MSNTHCCQCPLADYNKAIELNPRDANAYNNRAIAYYFKREHDKAWDDVYKAQSLGYQVYTQFLKALREASGRQR